MSKLTEIWTKISRNWTKIRLQPIRVYCLHHVCSTYDAQSMNECDWINADNFKSKVWAMQRDGVEFISLTEAYRHICSDWFRGKKYAVLTFDDGYASQKEILPWVEEQQIPATLFINGKYLDGVSYRENPKEEYLTKEELFAITSPLIEIGSHGWEHADSSKMTDNEFKESIVKNIQLLSKHPHYIPFYAYAYGRHNLATDMAIKEYELIPVLVNGGANYVNVGYLDRLILTDKENDEGLI